MEREVVVGLLQQTEEFLAPAHRERTGPTGDPFDDLVATLGVRPLNDPAITPQTPPDPALERLLPTAHRDDPEMAAEFRRLTEHGLRERKVANLAIAIAALRVPDSDGGEGSADSADNGSAGTGSAGDRGKGGDRGRGGDKVRLDLAQAQALVVALTDVRLLLGERLGLRTDDDADALQDRLDAASEDDPQLYLAAYYDFLTWLQESLAHALMSRRPPR